ncbi:hypothetical protein CIG2463D_0501 [Campylobacter iguaniorum]|uniref:hypothetical protein n=1 Tax=Campylobacter iguaniorum TaxID=1244531 RepID=UPI000739FF89|nr:hypothetical protein [Campylobacter iguaniorum]ALV24101.1 hypothetical protein CIG2463D_0501 [Campylobacter iguaniorum]
MQWLDEFKTALVSEDLSKIDELTNNYPSSMNLEEMKCAAALIQDATNLFKQKQEKLDIEFQKIKKAKQYNI